jgi:nucleoside-diphosphate-sugar epimerase
MKVIITGATGMIGRGVLLECLDHPEVSKVLALVRRPTGERHPKLQELIHEDFSDFSKASHQLEGYDACFATMGVSAAGKTEAEYKHLTYDMTMALAKNLHASNPNMTFNYVSGVGTDSSENGRQMWARIKGKTENDLLALGFKQAYMFRPGGIIPKRGVRSSTKLYQFFIDYFTWFLHLIAWINPNAITDTERIGQAMINAHLKGCNTTILTPKDINALAAQ